MAKNKITLNVLADISNKIHGGFPSDKNEKALIIFTASNISLDHSLEEIKELKQYNVDISLAFSFMAEEILDINSIIDFLNPLEVYREEDIFKLEEIVREYSYIVGPNITMNTLTKVSSGMVDSFASNIIWTFLYMGKKVYLDFRSVRNYLGEECKNKYIKATIDSHINILKKMEVVEIELGNYIKNIVQGDLKEKPKGKIEKPNNIGDKIRKKVLVEKDLKEYMLKYTRGDKLLNLPRGSIISPLARDKARELGIEIKIEN